MATLALINIMATLFLPPEANAYGLSQTEIKLLGFSIILPIIVIWFVALYGSLRFKIYAQSIVRSSDGRSLNLIANGLLVLVYSLAVNSTLQSFNPVMRQHYNFQTWSVLVDHIAVIGALAAFWLIYLGARGLSRMVNHRDLQSTWTRLGAILVPFALLYIWEILHNPYRNFSPDPGHIPSFYLTDTMLLLTLCLPYILTWVIGLGAVASLSVYYRYSKGVIYRRSLTGLIYGLGSIIGSSIVIQLITAIAPSLARLGLHEVLALLYGLIIIYAAGHVLILNGARKLALIEDVV
jgi:hypothetical protein